MTEIYEIVHNDSLENLTSLHANGGDIFARYCLHDWDAGTGDDPTCDDLDTKVFFFFLTFT